MANIPEMITANNQAVRDKTNPSSITPINVGDRLNAITNQLRPYYSYLAQVCHGADSVIAPCEVIVYENTYPGTLTWTRDSTGIYRLTSSEAGIFNSGLSGGTEVVMYHQRNGSTNPVFDTLIISDGASGFTSTPERQIDASQETDGSNFYLEFFNTVYDAGAQDYIADDLMNVLVEVHWYPNLVSESTCTECFSH